MGKLVAILGACVVVAGGVGYAMYSGGVVEDRADLASCPVAHMNCCGVQTECGVAEDATNPAMAVAGPVALFTTTPVTAEVGTCCAAKPVAVMVCCEAGPSDSGLGAVAGTVATLAK